MATRNYFISLDAVVGIGDANPRFGINKGSGVPKFLAQQYLCIRINQLWKFHDKQLLGELLSLDNDDMM